MIWRIQYQKDKIKNIESQLSERKYKMYSDLIYLIFDIPNAEKLGEEITQQDILKRILGIKRDMFLYAPDEMFKTFTNWTLELKNQTNGTIHFKIYFELMRLVRKDMGHIKTKIKLDDFMLFYMQDELAYKEFKRINGW
ncbi:hypothetical protein HNP37_002187 [Flavobacterium nitrogenifigens]|uniref:Uncharacterized protein n=2 Tax=Flavobacterium TaxID=237 RepID=A0A7W7N851_9FLAO|nr:MULTISPECIES: hypothetical protein [Flavobacterium]MBB4802114.1 hypothetical protein [Flavobacterium nitrogenifigens]MBB6387072.1 hypothetical protein [Flavobacterium notoginsengisoli]